MACGDFVVPRWEKTCACCGSKILFERTPINKQTRYRRIIFVLHDDVRELETFASFCPECAEHEWTEEWLARLERQCHAMWMIERSVVRQDWNPLAIRFVRAEPDVRTLSEVG
jgi:RNA polymerase subunit RPABC4/transcription elongation factor Spt4